MAHGAEFYNDIGKIQLADNSSNFFLAEKGSVVSPSGINSVTVTPSVPYNCIAVVPATNNTAIVPKGIDLITNAANTSKVFRKSGTEAMTLNWYAFRSYRSLTPATNGHGVELYNADGSVGFSSLYPYLMKGTGVRMIGTLPQDILTDTAKTHAFLYYGKHPGAVSNVSGQWRSAHRGRYVGRSTTPGTFYSAVITLGGYQVYDINISGNDPPNGYIILDVTHY